jgi:hypothetical protein
MSQSYSYCLICQVNVISVSCWEVPISHSGITSSWGGNDTRALGLEIESGNDLRRVFT